MTTQNFADYVQGKSFDEILHEGRRESADRLMSEALVPLAYDEYFRAISDVISYRTPEQFLAEFVQDSSKNETPDAA